MVTVLQGNRKQTNHREPGNATQVSDTNQWGFIIVNQGKYFKPPIGQYIIYVTRGQSKYVYMTLVVGSISYNYCSKNEYIQHGRVYMGCLVYISHVGICLAHRAEFLRVNKSCLPFSARKLHILLWIQWNPSLNTLEDTSLICFRTTVVQDSTPFRTRGCCHGNMTTAHTCLFSLGTAVVRTASELSLHLSEIPRTIVRRERGTFAFTSPHVHTELMAIHGNE